MQQKYIFNHLQFAIATDNFRWSQGKESVIGPAEQTLLIVQSKGHVGLGNSC